MPAPSALRIEWISLLYLALFVLAVLSPRLITHSLWGFSEDQVEEALIFALGVSGLIVFSIYGQLMERREKERSEAFAERDRARKELSSSYAYIGMMNRQMDALKSATNGVTSWLLRREKRPRKDLIQSLAASAAAFVRAPYATVRVVEVPSGRTVREYHASAKNPVLVHNKHLCALHEQQKPHGFLRGDAGDVLAIPSDRQGMGLVKAFILIPVDRAAMPEQLDGGILKVYANQAELLHHSAQLSGGDASSEPMALIRAAEEQVVGEVS